MMCAVFMPFRANFEKKGLGLGRFLPTSNRLKADLPHPLLDLTHKALTMNGYRLEAGQNLPEMPIGIACIFKSLHKNSRFEPYLKNISAFFAIDLSKSPSLNR